MYLKPVKTNFFLPLPLLLLGGLLGCRQAHAPQQNNSNGAPLVQLQEVAPYLSPSRELSPAQQSQQQDLIFWQQRLAQHPTNWLFQQQVAARYAARFRQDGHLENIAASDSLLHLASAAVGGKEAGLLRAMAENAITRHRFRLARNLADSAYKLGDKRAASLLQLVDAQMELGELETARRNLNQLADKNGFDYLIRKAKLQDHLGHLDSAITTLELTRSNAAAQQQPAQLEWLDANLGDFYTHANRPAQAYAKYLAVLKVNPRHLHCLRGIGWLAYTYDRNDSLATTIFKAVQARSPLPDALLLLGQVATSAEHAAEASRYYDQFRKTAQLGLNAGLYDRPLALLEADVYRDTTQARKLALSEIERRPNPESYDLLAWAYYRSGNLAKALNLIETQVLGRTEEPLSILHAGLILQQAGKDAEGKKLIQQGSAAKLELGPTLLKETLNQTQQAIVSKRRS